MPGRALFYGGLVRTKNMLSVLMQVFMIVSIAGLVWACWGYSMAFTAGSTPFVGGFSFMGGHEEIGSERPARPGAPVIRIRVYNLMGGASIYRLPPQARGVSLKDARRLAKSAERGELPAPE